MIPVACQGVAYLLDRPHPVLWTRTLTTVIMYMFGYLYLLVGFQVIRSETVALTYRQNVLLLQYLEIITLSGGSLGSCVDEERSQLRELM